MKAGKLELAQIESLFCKGLGSPRNDVMYGPSVGLDCGVVDVGNGQCAVLKSDPITFATDRIGWYAVNVNANDIATSGALPQWFLSTILLPEAATMEDVEAISSDLHTAANELGVAIVGGHTEVTPAVSQVVISGTMIGIVHRSELLHPSHIQAGDVLLLTKGAAIEATAIAAFEKKEEVEEVFGTEFCSKACAYLDTPGISVLKEARLLKAFHVRAMHDVTEGGFRAAAYEIASAAGLSIKLNSDRVPVQYETGELCRHFGMDPLGAIGSGALLAAVPSEMAKAAVNDLSSNGIHCVEVGVFLPPHVQSTEVFQGRETPLVYNPCDEITKLFR